MRLVYRQAHCKHLIRFLLIIERLCTWIQTKQSSGRELCAQLSEVRKYSSKLVNCQIKCHCAVHNTCAGAVSNSFQQQHHFRRRGCCLCIYLQILGNSCVLRLSLCVSQQQAQASVGTVDSLSLNNAPQKLQGRKRSRRSRERKRIEFQHQEAKLFSTKPKNQI